jgi:hypothetical protein
LSIKGQELVYAARVSPDRVQMQVEHNRVNLSPGMAVTAEIKTGSRTFLSAFAAAQIWAGKPARAVRAGHLINNPGGLRSE